MNKIFVTGPGGLLGSYLVKMLLQTPGLEVLESSTQLDITDPEAIEKYLDGAKPDIIINCAAYTNVENCEDQEFVELADAVNGLGPKYLAESCKKRNIRLFHISSDYVFGDNLAEGYPESYTHFNPLNKYGRSKLAGEQAVITTNGGLSGSDFENQEPLMYIIRTSWLFGPGATNFIAKIIKYAQERDHLEVVTDEIGSPTYIKDLCEVIISIINTRPRAGIYHVSGAGKCSRYDFAKTILKYAKIATPINPTTLEKFQRKARIPNISHLLNTKLPPLRNWEDMLADFILNEYQTPA